MPTEKKPNTHKHARVLAQLSRQTQLYQNTLLVHSQINHQRVPHNHLHGPEVPLNLRLPYTMRPTRVPSFEPPSDESPQMATQLSDEDLYADDSFGEPLVRCPNITGAANSSAPMQRSIEHIPNPDESPSRSYTQHTGSNSPVPAARINIPHGDTTDDEYTASDNSDEYLYTAMTLVQYGREAHAGPTGIVPTRHLVAGSRTLPNGSPVPRTRLDTLDGRRPGLLDNHAYSPVDAMVAGLQIQRSSEMESKQPSPLSRPPPKFVLPRGPHELSNQNRQAHHTGQDGLHPAPPLRTVEVRRSKYVVPRTLSRSGSFFNTDDSFVEEPIPTMEQALSWSYERVLMTKEQYAQKVAAMAKEKTNSPASLHDNDPFAALARSKRKSNVIFTSFARSGCDTQTSIGESSRAAAKATNAAVTSTRIQPQMSGTNHNTPVATHKGPEDSSGQDQDSRVALTSVASEKWFNPRKENLVPAEVYATRRALLKEKLAANGKKRAEILQQEQNQIDDWKASTPYQGDRLLEELQKFTIAVKEQNELRLRLLDNNSRDVQGRLNRLNHLERGGKPPLHL